jgi:hypothetical protein
LTRIQIRILIFCGVEKSASVANVMSASEATSLHPMDQIAARDYFSLCDAAETGEEIEPVSDLPNKTRVLLKYCQVHNTS